MPGDCPALDPREVDELLAGAMSAPDVVIVPDRHGTGTNALLLAPPDAIAPSFGPGSRERHEQAAAASGARWRVAEPRSLVLDVDTAEDLAVLRAALDARTGGAAHTRGLLRAGSTRPQVSRACGRGRCTGLPEVRPGDDLAALLRDGGYEPGDVLVVAHKVVSKAEGALRRLDDVVAGDRARELAREHGKDPRHVQVVLDESAGRRARRARRAHLPHPPRLRLRQRRRRHLQRRRGRRARRCCRATPTPRARALRAALPERARPSSSPTPSAAPGATGSATWPSASPASPRSTTGAGAATRAGASCARRGSPSPTRPPRRPTCARGKDSRRARGRRPRARAPRHRRRRARAPRRSSARSTRTCSR